MWGVVLAAGTGARFGGAKQFVTVRGTRLVDLAVRKTASRSDRTVVVLPPGAEWDGPAVEIAVEGGASRAESVRRALAVIPEEVGIVLVHAASHPLAPVSAFEAVLSAVRAGAAAAVPGLCPADVVRRVANGSIVEMVGRDDLVLVQSPAGFRAAVLRAAYAEPSPTAAEDTELVAAIGETIRVVPGHPRNIHVTTPQDLAIVAHLLSNEPPLVSRRQTRNRDRPPHAQ